MKIINLPTRRRSIIKRKNRTFIIKRGSCWQKKHTFEKFGEEQQEAQVFLFKDAIRQLMAGR